MSKIIDLTGQKFNRWTVIERANNIGTRAAWLCQCECGTKKIVRGTSLRDGSSKSCGCLSKEKAKEQIQQLHKIKQNLIGNKYGKLLVLSLEKENNISYWKCKCDCGNFTTASSNQLTSGKKKSCGCLRAKDITGQRFGKLLVLKKLKEQGADKSYFYECKCDCGNIYKINGSNLRSGHTQSCGCVKSQGELKIIQLLKTNNVDFIKEKTFETCRFPDTNALAKFDFWVNNEYLIEFDGIQHFQETDYFGESHYKKLKAHDEFKNNWCKKNNISLIRIPYYHCNKLNIEDLLLETSNFIEYRRK